MPQWDININVNPKEKQPPRVSFSPQTAVVGDFVFWANNDNEEAHWPGPFGADGKADKSWFPEAIPPNNSSDLAPSGGLTATIKYGCVLHDDEEGVIEVVKSPPSTP